MKKHKRIAPARVTLEALAILGALMLGAWFITAILAGSFWGALFLGALLIWCGFCVMAYVVAAE